VRPTRGQGLRQLLALGVSQRPWSLLLAQRELGFSVGEGSQRLFPVALQAARDRGHGVLVRFADDLLAMCHTQLEAEAALVSLRQILASLGFSSGPPRLGSCT
jgi:hypothetical protein